MNAMVDMTGMTIGDVVVLGRSEHALGRPAWRCQCPCGATFVATGVSLRQGQSKSCKTCAVERRIAATTKHGGVGSPEYVSYHGMRQRCEYQKNKRYARYGGRGIKVCERWVVSFANFLADMGSRPSPAHSIERLDVDKDYEPGNCVWATKEEQANNRSNNNRIEINGRIQNLTQWARESGVHRTVIYRRIQRGVTGAALITKGATL